jgi:hypothetical protein
MTRRRVLLIIASLVAVAVGTPALVLAAVGVGLEPTHWSGTRLADFETPLARIGVEAAPEPANILLSRATDADQTDRGDLAPSWWDADAGEVVLGAVTERGEQARHLLAQGSGVPYRVERRAHSVRELTDVMDAAIDMSEHGVFMTAIDPSGNRVTVSARCLSHDLFAADASRFGDTVAIAYAPFMPEVYLDEPPPDPPSWWSRTDPPGTWFTLATGFPWYLGAVLVIVGALWAPPWLGRRRQDPRSIAETVATEPD